MTVIQIIQFFIIYLPSQQPQGQLQAQHSVDKSMVTNTRDNWCQKLDWIEAIIGQKIYFTVPFEKMENMEFLKAMLAEMNASMKSIQEETKANQTEVKEEMKANQAKTEARVKDDRKHMQEMMKAN
jgi:gas vesicle protein